MKRTNFYVPKLDHLHWNTTTRVWMQHEKELALGSFAQTESALAQLDEDVSKIEDEIRGVWTTASAQMMRAFEDRLKLVRAERRRVDSVRRKLRGVLDRLNAELGKQVAV